MQVTSDILFVSWFGMVIILDRVGRILNAPVYTMDLVLLIISGVFLYAIHRTNTNNMKNIEKPKGEEG